MNVKLYWHVHHEVLCEPSTEIAERVAYIQSYKPEHERETRLRLMREIKNPPARLVEAAIVVEQLHVDYHQAQNTCIRAWVARDRADVICRHRQFTRDQATYAREQVLADYNLALALTDCKLAQDNCEQAWAAREHALVVYNKATTTYDQAFKSCRDELETLHKVECPCCPWNGQTIFPNT